jgi:hypothetical protein
MLSDEVSNHGSGVNCVPIAEKSALTTMRFALTVAKC